MLDDDLVSQLSLLIYRPLATAIIVENHPLLPLDYCVIVQKKVVAMWPSTCKNSTTTISAIFSATSFIFCDTNSLIFRM